MAARCALQALTPEENISRPGVSEKKCAGLKIFATASPDLAAVSGAQVAVRAEEKSSQPAVSEENVPALKIFSAFNRNLA